jgi:hypothetical protein
MTRCFPLATSRNCSTSRPRRSGDGRPPAGCLRRARSVVIGATDGDGRRSSRQAVSPSYEVLAVVQARSLTLAQLCGRAYGWGAESGPCLSNLVRRQCDDSRCGPAPERAFWASVQLTFCVERTRPIHSTDHQSDVRGGPNRYRSDRYKDEAGDGEEVVGTYVRPQHLHAETARCTDERFGCARYGEGRSDEETHRRSLLDLCRSGSGQLAVDGGKGEFTRQSGAG